jgi:acetyl-CoA carboxylase carboxyl transferase subunit beta
VPSWLAADETWDADIYSGNPLQFPGYAPEGAPAGDSAVTGVLSLHGQPIVTISMQFECFGGTMGIVAGEKIVRAFDQAVRLRAPVVAVTRSGGVRLQEGTLALLQMGRTSAARARHAAAGLLMLSVFDSPTTGGVYASWASLADLKAARRGAVMGFGGPRVVEYVTGQLPTLLSHSAEAAYARGHVDALLAEDDVLPWIESALGLRHHQLSPPARPWVSTPAERHSPRPVRSEWEVVQAARGKGRPSGMEWAAALTTSWTEIRGPEPAIRAGLATLIGGRRAVVVAMDRHARGDGAARPGAAGFRLARRAIELAARLGIPVLTIVDTPGAEPGPEQEADGLASEIAAALEALATASVSTVALCVGEAGSGGAMALSYTDRYLMVEDSVFPVIAPEVAGLVLYKDPGRGGELASRLGLTAPELLQLGAIDQVLGGRDVVASVRQAVRQALDETVPGDRHKRADEATRRWLKAPGAPASWPDQRSSAREGVS